MSVEIETCSIEPTEGEGALDVGRLHDPGHNFLVEGPDVVSSGLSTTVEVLGGELGDEDILAEGGVPVFDIGLEIRSLNVVPVNADVIDLRQ